jgi:UDP-3-O-[3-hydroxymyristoyl] glucosamine N-acyltransferase
MKMTVGEIAKIIGGDAEGDAEREAFGVSPLDVAEEGSVVWLERRRDASLLDGKDPAAVICPPDVEVEGRTVIRAKNSKLAFAKAVELFNPYRKHEPGIHPSAVVSPEAVAHPTCAIGPNCCVEAGAAVGAGSVLRANVFLGLGAKVGEGCLLHPNVVVLDGCEIGNNVTLHSGVVIGADGFGYVRDESGNHYKVPQAGRVVIEDDVEIGANSAVDRATLGETRVGRGAKIDNLVQIGHNTRIGDRCVICGSVGVSGSVTVGPDTIMGGQAGISDHINIGAGAIIGGKAGVISDVPDGKFYSGFPARPHRENIKILSASEKLPELIKRVEEFLLGAEAQNKKVKSDYGNATTDNHSCSD